MEYARLITRDDVLQERELKQLEGVTNPSLAIIRRKLQRISTEQLNLEDALTLRGLVEEESDVWDRLPDQKEPTRWLEARETLISWALDHTVEVQRKIEYFLEDPDSRLIETIISLGELGLAMATATAQTHNWSAPQKLTYARILMARLPATQQELTQELKAYPIRRPDSTVRQFLRRHQGRLELKDGKYYPIEEGMLATKPSN